MAKCTLDSVLENVMSKLIYWLPRIFAVLFTVFISLFALDVLQEPQWFLALFIHLIPSFLFLLLTAIAWKFEKIGGVLFLLTGIGFGFFFHSIFIASPLLVIGTLFIISSFDKNHLQGVD